MMRKFGWILVLTLFGCGTSQDRADIGVSLSALKELPRALFHRQGAPDPAAQANLRAALEADGKPVISLTLPGLGYSSLMVPYYPSKKGAMTWANSQYETVTLRDGVLVETRGLGPDLMASQEPSEAQISSASGSFHRIYEYLDGDDAVQQVDYDCDFSPGGTAKVQVLGLEYDTRLVVEDCSRAEKRFQNRYWFDQSGKMRQSEQLMWPQTAPMLLQRIVD